MPRAVCLLLAALIGLSGQADSSARREAPSYSVSSIVNSASNQPGFAASTFVTIYGTGLAFVTRAISEGDIRGNTLPSILPNTGVSVFVNYIRVPIFYVSPGQLNVLIPSDVIPGPADVQVVLNGLAGPVARITLAAAAPALFQTDGSTAIAVHTDGKLLTAESPGRPGEYIVLYATGLGVTTPQPSYAEIPMRAAPLRDRDQFAVLLDGVPVGRANIAYAGVAPGFAGLYQVNLKLPDQIGTNPEIRLQASGVMSQAGVVLPARP